MRPLLFGLSGVSGCLGCCVCAAGNEIWFPGDALGRSAFFDFLETINDHTVSAGESSSNQPLVIFHPCRGHVLADDLAIFVYHQDVSAVRITLYPCTG